MVNKKYDWKITLKKFVFISFEILLAGWIVLATERPEFIFLVPLLEAAKNWIKHRNK